MTKKCSGCGVLLQNDNIDKEGYVDDLNKEKDNKNEHKNCKNILKIFLVLSFLI